MKRERRVMLHAGGVEGFERRPGERHLPEPFEFVYRMDMKTCSKRRETHDRILAAHHAARPIPFRVATDDEIFDFEAHVVQTSVSMEGVAFWIMVSGEIRDVRAQGHKMRKTSVVRQGLRLVLMLAEADVEQDDGTEKPRFSKAERRAIARAFEWMKQEALP